MRTMFVLVIIIFATAAKAQTLLPVSFAAYKQMQNFAVKSINTDSIAQKKWFFSTYSAVSTSFNFFKGGNATVVSMPVGLQLKYRLNNNLYAFAGVSAAPAYINFNRSFLSADISKTGQSNPFLKSGSSFGIYSRAEMGLMYINDQKTFSISGSFGIERSSYPVFPYNKINTLQPNPVVSPNLY